MLIVIDHLRSVVYANQFCSSNLLKLFDISLYNILIHLLNARRDFKDCDSNRM